MKAIHLIVLWTAAVTTKSTAPNGRRTSSSSSSFWPSLVAGSTTVPNTKHADDDVCTTESAASPDALIERFLRDNRNHDDTSGGHDDNSTTPKKFHVQGWRWHTLSLVRDAGRLQRLALRKISTTTVPTGSDAVEDDSGDSDLDMAAEHVIDFNMKGLHAVEDELFFPWLRSILVDEKSGVVHAANVRNAFGAVLDSIETERLFVRKLASQVREQARIASSTNSTPTRRSEAASNVAQMSSTLATRTRDILTRQEQLLVPAVAALVPESEQKSFNSRVIRKLGIFDSRLHLVGMYDAVMETADIVEEKLFEEMIPMIPRMMIPRWRRKLYEPKAGVLEGV
uniref:RxLR effector candidate protein n=2 Tax=Leptocylindrus danicus TaxID=163516 RepID=A0A6U2S798_9STRA|mmetsp:Transcript_5678/g.8347  ORF Transcript_5678/g.8347 Transcript_5678/m.8347 type:complete len:340 (+) Transcript_5678:22-1041(+)